MLTIWRLQKLDFVVFGRSGAVIGDRIVGTIGGVSSCLGIFCWTRLISLSSWLSFFRCSNRGLFAWTLHKRT